MRYLIALVALSACAVWLASCGATPEVVAYDEVCEQPDGTLVQTEGYFAVGSSIFCSNIGSSHVQCGFEFVDSPDEEDGFTADVAQGTGPNQVEPIPDDFTPEAILIHASDGSDVRIGDRVTISGKLLVAENVCLVDVDTITKVQ
ncbi:MAG: hypothetical protein DIU80_006725 [Chloroflexota bacterium]